MLCQNFPDLSHLIWFRLPAGPLEIDAMPDARFRENMVAAFRPMRESQAREELAQVIEIDVRIGFAGKDAFTGFFLAAHD